MQRCALPRAARCVARRAAASARAAAAAAAPLPRRPAAAAPPHRARACAPCRASRRSAPPPPPPPPPPAPVEEEEEEEEDEFELSSGPPLESAALHLRISDSFLPAPLADALRGTYDGHFANPRATRAEDFIWNYWRVCVRCARAPRGCDVRKPCGGGGC
jgi:hypothetical protein